jgi:hypothetical protein
VTIWANWVPSDTCFEKLKRTRQVAPTLNKPILEGHFLFIIYSTFKKGAEEFRGINDVTFHCLKFRFMCCLLETFLIKVGALKLWSEERPFPIFFVEPLLNKISKEVYIKSAIYRFGFRRSRDSFIKLIADLINIIHCIYRFRTAVLGTANLDLRRAR